ncbi:hypothetical protein [Hufsiella ginkgonis]|uniref:Uncharacterized protein n=1 Tax=Hufsiella ginkgonis TaxID=2695274 RepID=A0A7K1XUD6_9SPHI|nr:hypothetical protein [Hufsiella ginkgonis]MXV14106.1 hypothetical protein [Hufsiella ginkgonis]
MEEIHVGELIKAVAKRKRLSNVELGKLLGTSPRNIGYTFEQKDMSVRKLRFIGDKLNHNFFADLYPNTVEDEGSRPWEELKELYKTESTLHILLDIEFPVSLSDRLAAFIKHTNAIGYKFGYKVSSR